MTAPEQKPNDPLRFLIERRKSEAFVPGYVATDEEGLALLISKFFQWDGVAILKCAALALEDANFHNESALVSRMAEQAAQ